MSGAPLNPLHPLAGWALQTGLWVGVLLGLVLILRRPFARHFGAQATYWLWAIPALRLVMPPMRVPQDWLSDWLPGWMQSPAPAVIPQAVPAPTSDFPVVPAPPDVFPTDMAPAVTPPIDWTPVLLALWIAGAVLWLGWQITRQIRFLRSLPAQTRAVPDALHPVIQAARSAVGLRKTPAVLLHSGELGPCVTGLLRPFVILPHDFETRFTVEQQTLGLIHEFAHIRRRDLPVSLLALIFRAINWPNPLVHIAARAFRSDQEAACDADVMSRLPTQIMGQRAYAATLLNAAQSERAPNTLQLA